MGGYGYTTIKILKKWVFECKLWVRGDNIMTELSDYNSYGEKLESHFSLRTSPMAVKMLETEDGIPEGAIRPSKDIRVSLR